APGRKTIHLDDAVAVAVPTDRHRPRLLNPNRYQSSSPNRNQHQPRNPTFLPKFWRNHRFANWPKITALTLPELHRQDNTVKSLVAMYKACLTVLSQLLRHQNLVR